MNILQNLAGMADMKEQVIATDFLLGAKASVRNYSIAISEVTTPQAREVLRRHLEAAINTHEEILGYMIRMGYYHVNDPQEQMLLDRQTAETALDLQ